MTQLIEPGIRQDLNKMAVYIEIKKQEDKQTEVVYSYEIESCEPGFFSINTLNGEIKLIKGIESENDEMLFARASHKVKKAFDQGDLPDLLVWAS